MPAGKNKSSSAYEVGYCRPPARTQFQPGQSGNPRGRPKKAPTFLEILEKEAARLVKVKTGNGIEHLSNTTVIVRTLISEARQGNLKAAAFVLANLRLIAPKTEADDSAFVLPDREALERIVTRLKEKEDDQ